MRLGGIAGGRWNYCPYEKDDREVRMDHTLALIGSHTREIKRQEILFKENTGLIYSMAKRFSGTRCGDGGSVPDRKHWTSESCGSF